MGGGCLFLEQSVPFGLETIGLLFNLSTTTLDMGSQALSRLLSLPRDLFGLCRCFCCDLFCTLACHTQRFFGCFMCVCGLSDDLVSRVGIGGSFSQLGLPAFDLGDAQAKIGISRVMVE